MLLPSIMSLYYPFPCPHNKHSNVQQQFLSLCRLQQLAMPSRVTVVLVSLLLATPSVLFWFWLVILPARVALLCPEECRCEKEGNIVNCSDAELKNIPSILPKHARGLVLDGNGIRFIENDSFVSRGVVQLEILMANFCKIRKIELGAFKGLKILTYLSLESNEISEIIPGTFGNKSRLEYLYLGNNIIQHLEIDVFSGLVTLKYIGLQGNKLQYLHPETLAGLPKLQGLHLSENLGLQIPTDRHFINSHSLKQTGISHCNVSSVSVETFANVTALEWLDLSYNTLRSLDINILRAFPKLSVVYLDGNALQCDCQLQQVWRWCQDDNIQTAYEGKTPECDTPKEVTGMWWGVLEKWQCLQGNTHTNTSYSYTPVENTDTNTDTDTETKQRENVYSFLKQYDLPVSAILFIFGTTGNVILIIIIICNKDMRTVPNMYILNLAISDIVCLTLLISNAWPNSVTLLRGDIMCTFLPFCYRVSVGLTAYSIAVLSIQRYRVTVKPLHVRVSSHPTWRATVATICGVWIVAALFAVPSARSRIFCDYTFLFLHTKYYQHIVIFELFVSCVLPLCVIAFCYIMTACHNVEIPCSLSEVTQNPQLNTRKNTAKVVLAITVIFLISYLPYHIFRWHFISRMNVDISSVKSSDIELWANNLTDIILILKHFLSINSCLIPVALCCTNLAFRRHFKRYLTCFYKAKSPSSDVERKERH